QAGHFLLGETDLLAAEFGQRQIAHFVRLAARGPGRLERMELLNCSSHAFVSFLSCAGAPPPAPVPSPRCGSALVVSTFCLVQLVGQSDSLTRELCLRRFAARLWLNRLSASCNFLISATSCSAWPCSRTSR